MNATAPASEKLPDSHGDRVDGGVVRIYRLKSEAKSDMKNMLIPGIVVPVHTRFQACYAIKGDNGQYYTREYIDALYDKWAKLSA